MTSTRPDITPLLLDNDFDPSTLTVILEGLHSGSLSFSPVPSPEFVRDTDTLHAFMNCPVMGNPEQFELYRPILEWMVGQGLSPFTLNSRCSSAYLDLISYDSSHPAIEWCLDLSCAPGHVEVDRKQRLRSEYLDIILMENPQLGSARQRSTLQLFDYKMLEQWADGRTTLDRLFEYHFGHYMVEDRLPHKDFELAEAQRGFRRLLKDVIQEDPSSPHMHLVRWHAYHYAHRIVHRSNLAGRTTDWGAQDWQGSLRSMDKELIKLYIGPKLTASQHADRLWQMGVEYALSMPPSLRMATVVVGAAWYQLLDAGERITAVKISNLRAATHHKLIPAITPSSYGADQIRALDCGAAAVHLCSASSVSDMRAIFAQDVGWNRLSKALLDQVVGPDMVVHDAMARHPAYLPLTLPLASIGGTWGNQDRNLGLAILSGASLPQDGPWRELFESRPDWPDGVLSGLQAQKLQHDTAISHARPSSRRM